MSDAKKIHPKVSAVAITAAIIVALEAGLKVILDVDLSGPIDGLAVAVFPTIAGYLKSA